MADPYGVDTDARTTFAHPRAVIVGFAFLAGLLDALGYAQFGVFTANQAGNLVIGWTLLPQDAAVGVLCLASVLGCGLGVGTVVLLRHAFVALAGPAGARALLLTSAALIVVAAFLGAALVGDHAPSAPLWSAQWWGVAGSVGLSAFALAWLATVFVVGGGVRASILASTNAYVDAVRYGTAALAEPGQRDVWRRRAAMAGAFPLAWTLGAAATMVLPFGRVALSIAGAVAVVVTAVLARRVKGAAAATAPTV